MNNSDDPQTRLRRQCRTFGSVAAVVVAISLLGVAGQIVFVAAPLWKGGPAQDALLSTGSQIVLSVPQILYVASLYYAGRVFRRIGAGEIFARANAEGLLAMGRCLLIGGVWAMIAEGLVPYAADQPLAQTMREVGRATEDPFMAVLGLALMLIGTVMARAARLKAQHDQFV
ncbi:MAG: hypothetical protein WDM77_16025 [Steroidobacteraceae bacterium]